MYSAWQFEKDWNKGNRRGKRYRNEEEKRKQKKKGRNTCLKGRMGGHVSSGEGRKLEEEVRRKQKNCTYQPERGRNL